MKYYKAKQDACDDFNNFNLVKGELLTESQRNTIARNIKDEKFEIVNIKKTKTYFFFGCRFEMEDN